MNPWTALVGFAAPICPGFAATVVCGDDGPSTTVCVLHAPASMRPMITFFIRSSPMTGTRVSTGYDERVVRATLSRDCPYDPPAPVHQRRPHRDDPPSP